MMRIRFGLILKIMARTKSYILPELCYLTNQSVNARNYNSFRGLSPVVPVAVDAGSRTVRILGRDVVLGEDGLPAKIVSHFSGSNTRVCEEGLKFLALFSCCYTGTNAIESMNRSENSALPPSSTRWALRARRNADLRRCG